MYLPDDDAGPKVHTCHPLISFSITDSPNVTDRGGLVLGNAARAGLSRCRPNRFLIALAISNSLPGRVSRSLAYR